MVDWTTIGDFRGAPGDTVTVPINISDGSGVKSIDFNLQYNTAFVSVNDGDVQLGALTSGWTLTPTSSPNHSPVPLSLSRSTVPPPPRSLRAGSWAGAGARPSAGTGP